MISYAFRLVRVRHGAAALAVVSIMVLSGCSEQLALAPGAVDASDKCSRFQQQIVAARERENQLQLRNVAAGAVTGAIVGASVGTENRTRGAILGAILGGGAAGAATASQQTQQRNADAAVLREVNSTAGTAQNLLTDAGRSAAQLRSCRLGQIADLERAVRGGEVATSAASGQLATLRQRADNDNRIISAAFNGIGQRVDSFVDTGARTSGVESAILTRRAAARSAAARRARAATPNVARAVNTQNEVQAADAQRRQQVDRGLDAIEVLLG